MIAPTTLALPAGFRPESLAIGAHPIAYFGSLADGSIHSVDLLSGTGRTVHPGRADQAGGLQLDRHGRLFVAGCFRGDAKVVDASTGELLASYQLAREHPTVVADVILAEDAAWFTDSFNPVLYRLPIGADGELPGEDEVETLALSGDLVYTDGFNVCGITTTPDGSGLLVVQANTGELFRVDPATGVATRVDLAGFRLPSGDGMLRVDSTLYVTLGLENTMAVVRLDSRGGMGVVVERISLSEFDVPTAVAAYDNRLVIVNSRITTESTPTTPYTAVVIQRE
jgi:streptogramin lyase